MKRLLKAIAPASWHGTIRLVIDRIRYLGWQRYCPCCNRRFRRFLPHGDPPRPYARCPFCQSVERDRLALIYLAECTDLFNGEPKRVLHVAPEQQLRRLMQRQPSLHYVSADLLRGDVAARLDLCDLPFHDASFDMIYCSHVLEHVPDDRRALAELRRVLKPSGWAMLTVPITVEETFEDPSVTSPEERKRLFGQHDHVRRYGPDYSDRLREAGFQPQVVTAADLRPVVSPNRIGVQANVRLYRADAVEQ